VSSKCGSADLLETLGVKIEAPLSCVEKCLDEIGMAFMFAPLLHSAMKHAIGPRREIAVRTIFNILGPLTNPAGAQAQVLGVFDKCFLKTMAEVLGNLGCSEAWVVHGEDGLDEVTTTGNTYVCRLKDKKTEDIVINPSEFGIELSKKEYLTGGDKNHNAKIAKDILAGRKGHERNIVVMNAAVAIVCGKKAKDIKEGIRLAEESIDSGNALLKLEGMIKITN
jgi:anthranilate phosphoribosyltransferase